MLKILLSIAKLRRDHTCVHQFQLCYLVVQLKILQALKVIESCNLDVSCRVQTSRSATTFDISKRLITAAERATIDLLRFRKNFRVYEVAVF